MAVSELGSSGFNYPATTNGAKVARSIIMSGVCVLYLGARALQCFYALALGGGAVIRDVIADVVLIAPQVCCRRQYRTGR